MEAKRYALDPVMGMLIDCRNMCGAPERLELVEEGTEDTFKCTGCGAEREMRYGTWTPFLSLHFSFD